MASRGLANRSRDHCTIYKTGVASIVLGAAGVGRGESRFEKIQFNLLFAFSIELLLVETCKYIFDREQVFRESARVQFKLQNMAEKRRGQRVSR